MGQRVAVGGVGGCRWNAGRKFHGSVGQRCQKQQRGLPPSFAKAVPVLSLVHRAACACLNVVPPGLQLRRLQVLLVRGVVNLVHVCRLSLFVAPLW